MSKNNQTYIKQSNNLPKDFFYCEAAGLNWLANADYPKTDLNKKTTSEKITRVARVISAGDNFLEIEKIDPVSASPEAAYNFGISLANTHNLGAKNFGSAPDTWKDNNGTGLDGYFGPLSDPVKMDVWETDNLADYLLNGRLLPMVKIGIRRGVYTEQDYKDTAKLENKLDQILAPLKNSPAKRVHGDLWSGNVLWTENKASKNVEAVLIDPAAHGGCAEEDLAMLNLFGISYYQEILQGYNSNTKIASEFSQRLTLWQLYPISGHAVFFGGGYITQYRSMLKSYL
ncbi:MAG: fructosamine kinase family protein [Bifidobacteriaceae bacterium]|jgi:fructosamine-3-kinase|nr:fructosamine kinase family protein [Bifidobacteriaceae bacterium]